MVPVSVSVLCAFSDGATISMGSLSAGDKRQAFRAGAAPDTRVHMMLNEATRFGSTGTSHP